MATSEAPTLLPVTTADVDTSLEFVDMTDLWDSPVPPCENPRHKGCVAPPPAELVIAQLPCPVCGHAPHTQPLICKGCWETAWTTGLRCNLGPHRMTRDEGWKILREL